VKGDLADVDLRDLIQVCCQHPDDVRLEVSDGEVVAVLYFSRSAIVHAESPRGIGKAALFDALNFRSGTFDLAKGVASPMRTIDQPWRSLLMEAAELVDQSRRVLAGGDRPAVGAAEAGGRTPAPGSPPDELVRRLRSIPGVKGALLCGPAGEVLSSGCDREPERLAAITAFAGGVATEVGRALSLGDLRHAAVEMGGERDFVIRLGGNFLGAELGEEAGVEQVCAQARTLLGGA
jgi:predicted regulator of Ras-like GTPase activity (Roadblock/LC7/MglB family)